jgi:mRNA interferase MazF
LRIPVVPSVRNGLKAPSKLIIDKITTVPKSKLGSRLGRLDAEDVVGLNRSGGVSRIGWPEQR